MNRFAALIDRLGYEPRPEAKQAILAAYFAATPDPERGVALAVLTDSLELPPLRPALLRALIAQRADPVLLDLSQAFVGDLAETVALLWPAPAEPTNRRPSLSEVVAGWQRAGKADAPGLIADWLDQLDADGRWALLKLAGGALRPGVPARLAKAAVAELGGLAVEAVEQVWHGLAPPYLELFAWVEGRGPMPAATHPAPFQPPMLAESLDGAELARLDPAAFAAEWLWDGLRVQAVAGRDADGSCVRRLYTRSGDDISAAFPDLIEALAFVGAIDGVVLAERGGRLGGLAALQPRLARKRASAKQALMQPVQLRAVDLLGEAGQDLRALPFVERRARLEQLIAGLGDPRIAPSPLIAFADWPALAVLRADTAGADAAAEAIGGVVLKRRDAPYRAGRDSAWLAWKREPRRIDCVLMYAQRGYGARSGVHSDVTFGVWRGAEGADELVPVGKAHCGLTDADLAALDQFVKANTLTRFGPVREVARSGDTGVVFEVTFEGLARSARHKSGLTLSGPRIAAIRWDKRPADADRIERLLALLG